MELGYKINWLITDRCNFGCGHCFAPNKGFLKEYEKNIPLISRILADSPAEKITISGGEPLVVAGLEDSVRVLHESGKYVSLHTNGTFLDRNRVLSLKGIVDDIYLSLDSMDEGVNDGARDAGSYLAFMKAFDLLRREGIRTGVHTVAGEHNVGGLEAIRNYVFGKGCFNWKVYEGVEEVLDGCDGYDGDVDVFLGRFLEAEDRVKNGDGGIQFVARDDRLPYLLLDNTGKVSYLPSFFEEGINFGNIFEKDFSEIIGRVNDFVGFDSGAFFESRWKLPLWVRYFGGEFDPEELLQVEDEEIDRFHRLSELYEKHVSS